MTPDRDAPTGGAIRWAAAAIAGAAAILAAMVALLMAGITGRRGET